MKITKEHLKHMQSAINRVLINNPKVVGMYEEGNFHNADRVKDLQKRFCFDLSYAAGLTKFYCETIYKYCDDTHIYTALKAICPKVVRKY